MRRLAGRALVESWRETELQIGIVVVLLYLRFRLATFAPCLPSAVRVFFARCATVRLRLAARAAFLMFRRAALFCFDEAILAAFPFVLRAGASRFFGGANT